MKPKRRIPHQRWRKHDNAMWGYQIYEKPHVQTRITKRSDKIKASHDRKIAQLPWIRDCPYALNQMPRIKRLHQHLQPEHPASWEDLITRIRNHPPTYKYMQGRIGTWFRVWSTQNILMMLGQPNNLPKLPPNTPIKQSHAAPLMNILVQGLSRDIRDGRYPTIMHNGVKHMSSTHLEALQYGLNPLTACAIPH